MKKFVKMFTLKTIIIDIALSFVGAEGLACAINFAVCAAFSRPGEHPYYLPFQYILGLFLLGVFVWLIYVYVKLRKQRPSVLGVIIDVVLSLVLFILLFKYAILFNSYLVSVAKVIKVEWFGIKPSY